MSIAQSDLFKNEKTVARDLWQDAKYQNAVDQLMQVVLSHSRSINSIRGPQNNIGELSSSALQDQLLSKLDEYRGNKHYFDCVASGMGNGPYVELMDGSVKLDFLSGIGIFFDGHLNATSLKERLFAATQATTMQSNIEPHREHALLLEKLLAAAQKVSNLSHGFLTTTGSMSNEFALKILRQKKFPASKILAFEDGFSGRTVMMSEITDSPEKRQNQPSYSEVLYLPFYDSKDPNSTNRTLEQLDKHWHRYGSQIAALVLELIQGEGGFRAATREFYTAIFERCKQYGILIWDDEVQTFGRTGTLFAFEQWQLGSYIDVVTCGKLLQNCAVLWTKDVNPKPGLVAATFVGSTASMTLGYSILDRLQNENFLGPEGKISKLSQYFLQKLQLLSHKLGASKLSDASALGGMIAVQAGDGSLETTQATIKKLFSAGLIAYYCGHGPYRLRFLPPMMCLDEQHIDQSIGILDTVLKG